MRAISVRQPWAWLIVNGHKDIENRDWHTKVRGQVLIHAAKGMTRAEYDHVRQFVLFGANSGRIDPSVYDNFPEFEDLERGGIVGKAEIVDCVSESKSPWFFGKYGFVLKNTEATPFEKCRGSLGFFYPGN